MPQAARSRAGRMNPATRIGTARRPDLAVFAETAATAVRATTGARQRRCPRPRALPGHAASPVSGLHEISHPRVTAALSLGVTNVLTLWNSPNQRYARN